MLTTDQTIIVAEHQPLFRGQCAKLLRQKHSGTTIVETESVVDTISIASSTKNTKLVLFGLNLPDTKNFSGLVQLKRRIPHVRIAVMSSKHDASVIERAFDNGAIGYIPKTVDVGRFKDATDCLLSGKRWVPDDDYLERYRFRYEKKARGVNTLTPAQHRVLEGILFGQYNWQIANDLNVAEATVKRHVSNIMRKLGVHTRTQIVIAMKHPQR